MKRPIIGFVAALFTWIVVASVVDRLYRYGLPGYAQAERYLTFTVPMMWSRLLLGALSSIAAGWIAARVAPSARRLPGAFGFVMLALFLPVHVVQWDRFPVWYHLLFLATIIPLIGLGARLAARPGNSSSAT